MSLGGIYGTIETLKPLSCLSKCWHNGSNYELLKALTKDVSNSSKNKNMNCTISLGGIYGTIKDIKKHLKIFHLYKIYV